jgi:type IV pilus assembly protein PilB
MPTDNTANSPQVKPSLVEKTKEYLEKKRGSLPPLPETNTDVVVETVDTPTNVTATSTAQPINAVTAVSVRGITNLADALFTKGIIDQETAKAVKFEALTNNQSIQKVITEKNLVTAAQLQQTKAEMYGLGYIDLHAISITQDTLSKLSKDIAQRNMAVVFEETKTKYKVAMEDPLDLQRVKFTESILGKKVEAYYATADAIRNIIDTRYGAQIGNEVSAALEDIGMVDINDAANKTGELDSASIEGAPVAKIVNMILDYAVKHEASDIHIEPRESRIAVRFRIHGLLSEKLTLPTELAKSVIARIKILSNMRIDEHRIPQDNRFQIKTKDGGVDIRVSVVPTIYGEKVVMRLLEKEKGILPIADLGIRGPSYKAYKAALSKTQGIILITGPVGSGKTVTLASSLSILNTQEVNIMTLEDPVEIRINGVTQVQVNPDVGLTFATGLRSFLRQDPDIIMVGEIRDGETAALAVQAALVGRLVLATLHTNSAAGALPRLLDIGVQAYLLASTINAVCAQRLVRKLCDECKQPYTATPETLQMLHKELDGLHGFNLHNDRTAKTVHFDSKTKEVTLYKPVGCPKCGGEGYSGRIGIFEVMTVSEKIGRMLMQSTSAREINKQAVAEGMITMVQDGFMKSMEGITTIEEVLRVQTL